MNGPNKCVNSERVTRAVGVSINFIIQRASANASVVSRQVTQTVSNEINIMKSIKKISYLTISLFLTFSFLGCEESDQINHAKLIELKKSTINLTGYRLDYIGSDDKFHYIHHRVLDTSRVYKVLKNEMEVTQVYPFSSSSYKYTRLHEVHQCNP